MERSHRIKKKSAFAKAYYWLFVLIALHGLYFLGRLVLSSLVLKNIDCNSQYGQCNTSVQHKLEGFRGEKYLHALSGIKSYIKEERIIDKYNFQYIPLASLKVNI